MRWVPRMDRPRRVREELTTPAMVGAEVEPAAAADPAGFQLVFTQLGTDGRFIAVGCSIPAWLTFYASAAARDADAQRPITADPSPSAGVLLDLRSQPQTTWLLLPPGSTYSNADTPLQARIWATLRPDEQGSNQATVTVLALVEHELALVPAPDLLKAT